MVEKISLKISPTIIELVSKPTTIKNNNIQIATSVLICSLMERLERLRDKVEELQINYVNGYCKLSVKATGETYDRILSSFEVVWCGFELLKESFPAMVNIERVEVDNG